MKSEDAGQARRLWVLLEAIHTATYFTPHARAAYEEAGLRGFWRGYFAGRAAPLGAVGPAMVVSTFYSFAPSMITRAVPDVWSRAAPEKVLAARLAGATAALGELGATTLSPEAAADAAELAWRGVPSLDIGARPLAAANIALEVPDEPLSALWLAATVWREYRGDGHIAVLATEGIGGLPANVLRDARDSSRALTQPARGWTDAEWAAAADDLRGRGLIDAAGKVTDEGAGLSAHIEARTDAISAGLVTGLSGAERDELFQTLEPLAIETARLANAFPNPSGAPSPLTAEARAESGA